jgi:oligopeptide transport system substrate-binding protein
MLQKKGGNYDIMNKKNLSKVLALLLSVMMLTVLFAGCGKSSSKDENQKIVYNLGAQPQTIDPAKNTATDGGNVITACFEGLTRYDKDSKMKPGVAEKWDISDDKVTYTFHLRKDAKWSDGSPVTADDFVYAWKRVLDPATEAAYVYQLFCIKGAEEYYTALSKKEDADFNNVGIKVKDPNTLEVTLKAPTPYFLELCSFATFMPLKKDAVEKDPEGWTMDPSTYIGNGPFKLTEISEKEKYECAKNDKYWDAKNVKLNALTFVMIIEPSSAMGSYDKGDVDVLDAVPPEEIQRLKDAGEYNIVPYIGTYFACFNTKKAPFDNEKVREAFTLAIDRQPLIDAILKAGQKPATAFVPYGIYEEGTTEFRTKGGDYYKPEGDVAKAKQLLADAGYPNGQGLPEITYLYNTSENHKAIAEALQNMWYKNLGVKVKIQNMDWAVFQDARQQGNYQIARHGWIGDYSDPMTFLDMWVTGGGNDDAKYSNPQYDKLIKDASAEPDAKKRMEMLHQAEDILMKDYPVCPLYFYVNQVVEKPYVKGVYKVPTGGIYFDNAYIDEDAKAGKTK